MKTVLTEDDVYIRLEMKSKFDLQSSLSIKNKYNLEWNKSGIKLDDRFKLENKEEINGYFFNIYSLADCKIKLNTC